MGEWEAIEDRHQLHTMRLDVGDQRTLPSSIGRNDTAYSIVPMTLSLLTCFARPVRFR